jgi:hypothetical protein
LYKQADKYELLPSIHLDKDKINSMKEMYLNDMILAHNIGLNYLTRQYHDYGENDQILDSTGISTKRKRDQSISDCNTFKSSTRNKEFVCAELQCFNKAEGNLCNHTKLCQKQRYCIMHKEHSSHSKRKKNVLLWTDHENSKLYYNAANTSSSNNPPTIDQINIVNEVAPISVVVNSKSDSNKITAVDQLNSTNMIINSNDDLARYMMSIYGFSGPEGFNLAALRNKYSQKLVLLQSQIESDLIMIESFSQTISDQGLDVWIDQITELKTKLRCDDEHLSLCNEKDNSNVFVVDTTSNIQHVLVTNANTISNVPPIRKSNLQDMFGIHNPSKDMKKVIDLIESVICNRKGIDMTIRLERDLNFSCYVPQLTKLYEIMTKVEWHEKTKGDIQRGIFIKAFIEEFIKFSKMHVL